MTGAARREVQPQIPLGQPLFDARGSLFGVDASHDAMASAREGAKTCLVEPTDWLGGQMTASGVPAIDYAWHETEDVHVGPAGKNRANLPSEFVEWMDDRGRHDPIATIACDLTRSSGSMS